MGAPNGHFALEWALIVAMPRLAPYYRPMAAVHDRADNAGVLRYLGQGATPVEVSVEPMPADVDRWKLGSHPDIVDRLWDDLNAALPADSRFLIAGGAALVHPQSGAVLAAALGTQYALRVPGAARDAALLAGAETTHTFSTVGVTLDLAATFGPDWIFGRFDEREAGWIAASYAAYG
jgi:hypothetical protein